MTYLLFKVTTDVMFLRWEEVGKVSDYMYTVLSFKILTWATKLYLFTVYCTCMSRPGTARLQHVEDCYK